MSSLLAVAPVFTPGHHQAGSAKQIVRVAPPVIFYAGLLFLGMVVLSYWLAVRRHLENCTCPKPKKWWGR